MGFFDQGYDRADALTGPVHAVIAPVSEAVPAGLENIIALVADVDGIYEPQGDWAFLGLSSDSSSYSVTHDTEEIEYEQPSGALFEALTAQQRQFVINFGSITPENMQIVENAPPPSAIAAGPGKSAQTALHYGAYSTLTEYRVALIAQRRPAAAPVIEEAGAPPRGGFVANVGYRVTLAAEDREEEYSKGEPVGIEVTFSAFPEPGEPAGKEYGVRFFEDAGTIAA